MGLNSLAKGVVLAALGVCALAAAAASDVSEIAGRTQRYSDLLVKMDAEALAAFYVADAQVSVTGGQAIKGRDAIKAHLQDSMGFQVLSDTMTADNIAVKGAAASVDGTYTEQMRSPKGKEFSAHGKYRADWIKDKDGVWRIKTMVAMPQD